MYQEFFGFRALPFASAPDPNVFYLNAVYQTALGTLRYGVLAKKGLIVLTGAAGTGKTALLRKLFDDLGSTVKPIWLVSSKVSFSSVLRTSLSEFELNSNSTELSTMIDALHGVLLQSSNKSNLTCLIIEEAQRLDGETLEGLRQLCNLETDSQKLLQLILVGNPEFMKKLDQPEHRSLKQRVALHCRLFPLTRSELERYIEFHVQAAGYQGANLFNAGAIERIAHYSGGIPRLVNTICDNALLAAHRVLKADISRALIDDVASDMGLVIDHQPKGTTPLVGMNRVGRKGLPVVSQSAGARWDLRSENATAKSVVSSPRRSVARLFSAALLVLIPLGGAGWALYFKEAMPFLQYFKSQLQAGHFKFTQLTATPVEEPVKPLSLVQAAGADAGAAVWEGRPANVAPRADPTNLPTLEASAPHRLQAEGKDNHDAGKTDGTARGHRPALNPFNQEKLLEAEIRKAIQNRAIEGVSVNLIDGTLYLDGQVASERQRFLAEQAAAGVTDAVKVNNRIEIQH